jgi:hypothetical protein
MEEIHLILSAANRDIGTIIADVDAAIARVPSSVQASGVALWGDLQAAWNAAYVDMQGRALGNATAGVNAHEAYKWGDRQSTAIMS